MSSASMAPMRAHRECDNPLVIRRRARVLRGAGAMLTDGCASASSSASARMVRLLRDASSGVCGACGWLGSAAASAGMSTQVQHADLSSAVRQRPGSNANQKRCLHVVWQTDGARRPWIHRQRLPHSDVDRRRTLLALRRCHGVEVELLHAGRPAIDVQRPPPLPVNLRVWHLRAHTLRMNHVPSNSIEALLLRHRLRLY